LVFPAGSAVDGTIQFQNPLIDMGSDARSADVQGGHPIHLRLHDVKREKSKIKNLLNIE